MDLVLGSGNFQRPKNSSLKYSLRLPKISENTQFLNHCIMYHDQCGINSYTISYKRISLTINNVFYTKRHKYLLHLKAFEHVQDKHTIDLGELNLLQRSCLSINNVWTKSKKKQNIKSMPKTC